MVTDERPEEFTTKAGKHVKQQALHCVDMSLIGARLGPPLVIALTAEQAPKYSTKLRDKFLLIDIADLEQFGKVFKVRDGDIVSFDDGKDLPKP